MASSVSKRDTIQFALAQNSMGSMQSRIEMPGSEEHRDQDELHILGLREHRVKQSRLGNSPAPCAREANAVKPPHSEDGILQRPADDRCSRLTY